MTESQQDVFLRTPAICVSQPLGEFFAVAIPAGKLLQVCYTDRLTAKPDGETYRLDGSQRGVTAARLRAIGRYIDTTEAAFPNSVILAANYDEDDGLALDNPELKWRVDPHEDENGFMDLIIPTDKPLAPIIDGQHRLFGFTEASKDRLNTPILCSVFLDLPRPYQAYLFATINSTQKPVDRSQTYELFGYNIEDEPPETWSPEKLAVFLTRKLNTDPDSPLHKRILIAAENDFAISRAQAKAQQRWMVSTATVVDGIARLISSSPRKDADALRTGSDHKRTKLQRNDRKDNSPLRDLYLNTRDKLLLTVVTNFFKALIHVTGHDLTPNSYLTKTVGMQALFDTLRALAPSALGDEDFSQDWFKRKLDPIAEIDFSHKAFQQASGQGRSQIRSSIAVLLTLPHKLKEDRIAEITEILAKARKR